MPDPLVSRQFTMHGARAAIEGGLSHIEDQVKSIEQAVVEKPGPRPLVRIRGRGLSCRPGDGLR